MSSAWKVAYADFVTALMAFFLLMWILNMTPPETKEGLASYFAQEALLDASNVSAISNNALINRTDKLDLSESTMWGFNCAFPMTPCSNPAARTFLPWRSRYSTEFWVSCGNTICILLSGVMLTAKRRSALPIRQAGSFPPPGQPPRRVILQSAAWRPRAYGQWGMAIPDHWSPAIRKKVGNGTDGWSFISTVPTPWPIR